MDLNSVVRAAIHPAIGVARVGDSPEEFFIGPETPHSNINSNDSYKDPQGRIKRQVAKFRVYGYNDQNEVVGELCLKNDVDIKWKAHVSNKKSGWYNFEVAMDIPEAVAVPRRNAQYIGEERKQLVIDPGPVEISGSNLSGSQYYFDKGKFFDEKVYLGELRTDEDGRLLFFGGYGKSQTPFIDNPAYTFANNDGWHDDTSDGPVTAEVNIGGKKIPVEPAWVITAPPNYAPDLQGTVTIYDVMTETTLQQHPVKNPAKVSFKKNIYPVFKRMCMIEWVNKGFLVQFGWDGPQNFLRPDFLAKLASNSDIFKELRTQVFNSMRDPSFQYRQQLALPWMYGDAMTIVPDSNRNWLVYPPHIYDMLRKWAEGDFIDDWETECFPDFKDIPIAEQPATLDRAALDYCLGEAFHPGCEMTWPVRHSSMYSAPYRILHRSEGEKEPDYGDNLEPSVIAPLNSSVYGPGTPGGPLYAQGPGDITRWMAVPWQTDTASCRDGYEKSYDEFLPTFWPARVPNQVLAEKDYKTVMDDKLPIEERKNAFNNRNEWINTLPGNSISQINHMITSFGKLGIVEARPGLGKNSDFPENMFVESQPGKIPNAPKLKSMLVEHKDIKFDKSQLKYTDKARRRG